MTHDEFKILAENSKPVKITTKAGFSNDLSGLHIEFDNGETVFIGIEQDYGSSCFLFKTKEETERNPPSSKYLMRDLDKLLPDLTEETKKKYSGEWWI